MNVKVTTTGSFPRIYFENQNIELAIQKVVEDQIEAGVDILVDGQLRADIVGIFAHSIGLKGDGMPYEVSQKIKPPENSILLPDLRTAAKYAGDRPLKAHITGPSVIAENCHLHEDAPNLYVGDDGFINLTLDIANALAHEVRWIAQESKKLNIRFLQIDEPSLVFGGDLEVARKGLEIVTKAWKSAGGEQIIMHVCWDFTGIFQKLLEMPVDILNLEAAHVQELSTDEFQALQKSEKKIALGVIPVNTDQQPAPERIAREALFACDMVSPKYFWGLTPVCGMRSSTPALAKDSMRCLARAASILEGSTKHLEVL